MADFKLDLTANQINQALKDVADKLSRFAVVGEEKTEVIRVNSNKSVEVIRGNKTSSIARFHLGDYGFVQDRMHNGDAEDAINYRTCFLHNCYIEDQLENRYKVISKWIPAFKIELGDRKIRFAVVPTTSFVDPDGDKNFWEAAWQTIFEVDVDGNNSIEKSRTVTTLINDTGVPSVKGSVVSLSNIDNAFKLTTLENNSIGVVLDNGVANGQPCRVVTGGTAQILLKDGTGSTAGHWVKGSATPGRAETAEHPMGNAFEGITDHFKEMGHCRETKTAGTNVLCWVELHFN